MHEGGLCCHLTSIDNTSIKVAEILNSVSRTCPGGILSDNLLDYTLETYQTLFNENFHSEYLLDPEKYSSTEVCIFGLLLLCKTLHNKYKDLTTETTILKQTNEDLSSQFECLVSSHQKILEDSKNISLNTDLDESTQSLCSKINEQNLRINFLIEKHNEEISAKDDRIDTLSKEKDEIFSRICDLERTVEKLESDRKNIFTKISDLFGVSYSTDLQEIVREIRSNIGASNTEKSLSDVLYDFGQNQEKYFALLNHFNVDKNEANIPVLISDAIESKLIDTISKELGIDDNFGSVLELVNSLLHEKRIECDQKSESSSSASKNNGNNSGDYASVITVKEDVVSDEKVTVSTNVSMSTWNCIIYSEPAVHKRDFSRDQDVSTYEDLFNVTHCMNSSCKNLIEDLRSQLDRAHEEQQIRQDLERKNRSLNQSLESYLQQINDLKSSLDSERNKKKSIEIQMFDLREKYEDSLINVESMNLQISLLKEARRIESEEGSRSQNHGEMVNAFDLIMQLLDTQSKEIRVSEERTLTLIASIMKQKELIDFLEGALISAKEPPSPKHVSQKTSDFDEDALLDALMNLGNDGVEAEYEEMLSILKEGRNIATSITATYEFLFQTIRDIRETDSPETKRLLNLLSSQLRYVESIMLNEDLQPSIRRVLIETCEQSHMFLQKYASGILEDSYLFDLTNINEDPLKLKDSVEKLLNSFPEVERQPESEMLIVVRQCISAINTLRRYCISVNDQFGAQNAEIRELRSILDEKERHYTELKDAYDKLCEDNCTKDNSGSTISEQLSLTSDKLSNPVLVDQCVEQNFINDLEEIRVHIERGVLENEVQIRDLSKRVLSVVNEFNIFKDKYTNLRKICKKQSYKCKYLHEKLEEERNKATQYAHETMEVRNQFPNQLDNIVTKLKEEYNENVKEYKQRISDLEDRIESLKSSQMQSSNSTTSSRKRILELQESEANLKAELLRMGQEIKSIKKKLSSTVNENRALEAKVKMQDIRFEEERKRWGETERIAVAAAVSSEKFNKAEAAKEFEDRFNNIITNIYEIFHEYADLTRPMDEEGLYVLIRLILGKLKNMEIDRDRLLDVEREFNKTRNLIGASPDVKLSSAVSQLL